MKSHFRTILRAATASVGSFALSVGVCANPTNQKSATSVNHAVRPLSDAEVRARADSILAKMTLDEKAGQLAILFAIPIPQMIASVNDQVASGKVGSLLFATDPKEINRLQHLAVEKTRLGIPLLFGFDVVHGLSSIFPVPIANAASWDPEGVTAVQGVAAREARAVGIHWTFAPMVDIARDPRWGRIVEGAGEDPYLGAAMAAAQVHGFQGAAIGSPDHIIAGPKHFVGYGASLGGRDYDEVNLSDNELWNVYLPPFKAAIDAGAGNIMTAYMAFNGIPLAGNHWLISDVLRSKLGFKGWVVSDNEAVKSLQTHGFAVDATDATARAINAGLDMEMALMAPAAANLPKAVANGTVSEARIDDAVRHVLEAKIRMGLFENPYVDEARAASVLRSKDNLIVTRIAAERSAVLLKNEGALLPLDRKKLTSIAVIGPLADAPRDTLGPWVFNQNEPVQTSLLAGIRAKAGKAVRVDYAPGVEMPKRLHPSPFAMVVGDPQRPVPKGGDDAGIAEAVASARKADVAILVLGETESMIGEAASRSTLELPGRQKELLDAVVATGKPVVILLMNGRPLDLGDTQAKAIMDIWYPGSEGGPAVANLLFGDAVPGGKLPFTWPRNVGQIPMIYAHLGSHDPKGAQKRYWNEPNSPAYPFGYGLSYSTFSYSNLHVDRPTIRSGQTVTISVDLRNLGQRQADDVAQLYIRQRSGTAARPVRELKGFQRITLKPGEMRTLTFRLGPDELRYWNPVAKDWVIDPGVFDLGIGGDSTADFGTTVTVLPEQGR